MVMVASKAAVAMVVFSGVMGMVVLLGSMVMLGTVCQPSALLPHARQLLSWTPPCWNCPMHSHGHLAVSPPPDIGGKEQSEMKGAQTDDRILREPRRLNPH